MRSFCRSFVRGLAVCFGLFSICGGAIFKAKEKVGVFEKSFY